MYYNYTLYKAHYKGEIHPQFLPCCRVTVSKPKFMLKRCFLSNVLFRSPGWPEIQSLPATAS